MSLHESCGIEMVTIPTKEGVKLVCICPRPMKPGFAYLIIYYANSCNILPHFKVLHFCNDYLREVCYNVLCQREG